MSDISTRISAVVQSSGLTKSDFAARLGLSQPHISRLCSGDTAPSDRTILDICREFKVREAWLRTGEGEMLQPYDPDVEIAAFLGEVMSEVDGSIRKRLIAALSRLTPEEWAFVEKFARDLAGQDAPQSLPLEGHGAAGGAVVNDSPVDCQSRAGTEPAGETAVAARGD